MNASPKVSVLMTVYEEEPYVEKAVDSILTQTYENIEFVVIDDGSEDGTQEVLRSYDDPRLVYVENERNVGLIECLNRGLSLCDGKYVARMDGDDIAREDRLEKQVQVLETDPDIGIVGSNYRNFNKPGSEETLIQMPEADLEIRWSMLLHCSLSHPTVVIEREILEENDIRYSHHYPIIEDYEIWPRVLKHTRAANVQEPLVRHRNHEGSRSLQQKRTSLRDHDKIALRTIREYVPDFETTQEEVSRLRVLFDRGGTDEFSPYTPDGRRAELVDRYLELLDAFAETHRGNPDLEVVTRNAVKKAMRVLLDETTSARDRITSLPRPDYASTVARAFRSHPSATIDGVFYWSPPNIRIPS